MQQRSLEDILSPGKYDYPFEKYIQYGHTVEQAADTILGKISGRLNKKPEKEFILKYLFENEDTKRFVFLYSVRVASEDQIKKASFLKGKFWTIKQIEDAFADEILAENFELEYEYIKNMVLLNPNSEINQKKKP